MKVLEEMHVKHKSVDEQVLHLIPHAWHLFELSKKYPILQTHAFPEISEFKSIQDMQGFELLHVEHLDPKMQQEFEVVKEMMP